MSYLSPFILFESIDKVPTDTEISHLKKRLMAEIDLSDDMRIVLNNYMLDKTIVSGLIEELEVRERVVLHFKVYKMDWLINFLNGDELAASHTSGQLKDEPGLKEFIKPYIADAYDHWFHKSISQNNLSLFVKLKEFQLLHLIEHNERFKETEKLLQSYIDVLNNQQSQVTKRFPMEGDMHPYYNEKLISMLNLLPVNFDAYRELYGRKLLDLFVIVAQKQEKPFLAENLIRAAETLNTSEDLKAEIAGYLSQINKIQEKQEEEASFRWVIYLLVLGVFFFIKCVS